MTRERLFRCAFTWAELSELIRALDLIQQEDEAADVNMAASEVASKASAMAKLEQHCQPRRALTTFMSIPAKEQS